MISLILNSASCSSAISACQENENIVITQFAGGRIPVNWAKKPGQDAVCNLINASIANGISHLKIIYNAKGFKVNNAKVSLDDIRNTPPGDFLIPGTFLDDLMDSSWF